ncbi:focadhesin-like [Dendronephthya gigantea]|uniref:focadhesin-like n=1 Tax=Dendronephthya gigantea TaxID=151771 RepID=UPI00106D56D1|nr:focadhesin-like [Dendronephthya gigantea]
MIMELPNNLIQEQDVWQLLPIILSKKTSRKHALSDKECQQIKEVGQLWTKCCDPCCVISLAAVDVLVHLVVKNVLDFSYVMHGFVAQTLSTRHILGPIHGVTKLLCFQVKSTIEVDSYTLSSNLHPYTKILANCPWSWPMLLQEVENIFQTTNKRFISSFVAIFEAFFQHVFFNPKTDYSACKSLHVLLLEISSDMMEGKDIVVFDRILKLITNHLRFYKVR